MANVSGCQPSKRMSESSDSRTEMSSSTMKTIGVVCGIRNDLATVSRINSLPQCQIQRRNHSLVTERFEQTLDSALFDQPKTQSFVPSRGDEDDRDHVSATAQFLLQTRAPSCPTWRYRASGMRSPSRSRTRENPPPKKKHALHKPSSFSKSGSDRALTRHHPPPTRAERDPIMPFPHPDERVSAPVSPLLPPCAMSRGCTTIERASRRPWCCFRQTQRRHHGLRGSSAASTYSRPNGPNATI